MSLEQAGHEARFACFREMAEAWQIDKLALGHHKDDRAESSLLHLIRGCGLDGLAAMPPKDGWIIRPLAQVSKGELLHYCEAHHLHYFTDSSNLEPECLRNQIRLELLPQLREYNPRIVDALLRLQECCSADTDYLEQSTEQIWRQYGSCAGGCVQFPATVWGDIITAINGVSVTTMEQLNRVKNQYTAGDTITLTIYRGGVSSDVEIILMDRANA